tara:strand:+ start:268 stop:606 length:339 start_codon:yes stop_codon:yes gene_type:complete
MPKVTYTPLKGLVQAAGGGFVVNSILTTAGTVNLDATTFLTVLTGTSSVTLPASADTGAIKIIICDQGTGTDTAAIVATNTIHGSNVELNDTGEMAICIYNGTEWVVGRSLQ